MKRHVQLFIAILPTLAVGHASTLDTAALLESHAAVELLEKNCICTDAAGVLPIRFATAVDFLGCPDLVQRIQKEYRHAVSKDGTIDFPIVGTGNGTYYYVNEKNQRTDLFELCRRQTSATTFDLVYLAKGKRFFGKYEVLIHIRILDAGAAGTIYSAAVHAYPHNAPLRFLARRFGTIERYFQRKTRLIAWVSTRICEGMEDQPFLLCNFKSKVAPELSHSDGVGLAKTQEIQMPDLRLRLSSGTTDP